jgi:alkanesulfonate monooxygenase
VSVRRAPVAHWFLPTGGDGNEVGTVTSRSPRAKGAEARPATIPYLAKVALAVEDAGFDAVLTPTGSGCEDAWIACSALLPLTTRLRYLVAFRPGFVLPTLAAQQAHSFQKLSGGRLLVNIVTGGDPAEQRAYGDFLDHDARYRRTDEFLDVFTTAFEDANRDFAGEHYQIEHGGLLRPSAQRPPIYFGGASPVAEKVAARRADVYLAWGERIEAIQPRIDKMQTLAASHDRTLRFGIRFHVIARETSDEAWREAERLLEAMDPEIIAANQARFAQMDSVGQARMQALHGGCAEDLVIGPNLWAGVGLVRAGAAVALVGSYEEVAERLAEYYAIGIDEFILSGYPHLEEATRVGEQVLPLLARTWATVPTGT